MTLEISPSAMTHLLVLGLLKVLAVLEVQVALHVVLDVQLLAAQPHLSPAPVAQVNIFRFNTSTSQVPQVNSSKLLKYKG